MTAATAPVAVQTNEPRSYRFLIEAMLFLSYFVFGMSWIGYSPFLKEIQAQFALDYAKTGLVISAVSFAKIFLPFVAGWMAVRLGVSRALLIGNVCICASLYAPFATTFPELIGSRILFGVGGAIVVTLLGPAVLQWFPAKELALVNGFNYVAVNSGITLSLFLTIPLAARFGRVNVLVGYAAISTLIAVGWIVFGKDRVQGSHKTSGPRPSYAEIFRMKEAWWLTLAAAGPLCVYLVFNTWLPTFYKESLGLGAAKAAQLTGLANMVGIPAAIVGGILTQRTGLRKPFILASGVLTGVAAFGLFMTSNMAVLSVSAVVFGIGLFLWVAPLTTLAMEIPGITPQKLAILNGVFFSVGYMLAFIAPLIAGKLRDATGSFVPGFVVFSLFSFSLFFGGMMLKESGKGAQR
jgi:MFS transporter, CP family, cyanate transporter